MDWGPQVEDSFGLIVFLQVPTEVRLQRLESRELQRFGVANPGFLEWAAQYDEGPPEGRSLSRHRAWLVARQCPVIHLSGDHPVNELLPQVLGQVPATSMPSLTASSSLVKP